jgi:hypothetical protein
MRDIEPPLRGPDRLDISRADTVLHDAATIWLVNSLTLYEGDTPLGGARIVAVRASLPADVRLVGIDEDTAAVADGERRTWTVAGRAGAHLYQADGSVAHAVAGASLSW